MKAGSIKCKACGHEFKPRTRHDTKYCSKCSEKALVSLRLQEKIALKKNPNENIYKAVRATMKLGISYGQYMGRRF